MAFFDRYSTSLYRS